MRSKVDFRYSLGTLQERLRHTFQVHFGKITLRRTKGRLRANACPMLGPVGRHESVRFTKLTLQSCHLMAIFGLLKGAPKNATDFVCECPKVNLLRSVKKGRIFLDIRIRNRSHIHGQPLCAPPKLLSFHFLNEHRMV